MRLGRRTIPGLYSVTLVIEVPLSDKGCAQIGAEEFEETFCDVYVALGEVGALTNMRWDNSPSIKMVDGNWKGTLLTTSRIWE